MPKTRCPHCRWLGDAEAEQIGLLTDCPECGKEFMIVAAMKTGPARAGSAATPVAAAPKRSRLTGCLKHLVLQVIIWTIVGLVLFVPFNRRWGKDREAMAAVQIELSQRFGKGQYDAAYLELAKCLSSEAHYLARTKDFRGKQTGYIDTDVYRSGLTRLMERYTADLSPTVNEDFIYKGYWVVSDTDDAGTRWAKYRFMRDGTAYRTYYRDEALRDEIMNGERKVTISGNDVTWAGDTIDRDRIILFSYDLMIFDELDGTYTCWMYRPY